MERSEILASMGELKLYGMRTAYDEIITTVVKRQHDPQRVVGDLLSAEITEKQARSIKYQITIAKFGVGQGRRRLLLRRVSPGVRRSTA